MESALAEYLGHLRVERGLAANSIDAYRTDLRGLTAFLAAAGVHNLGQVDLQHLHGWLRSLADRNLASATVARKVDAARLAEIHRKHHPLGNVQEPRQDAPKPKARARTRTAGRSSSSGAGNEP